MNVEYERGYNRAKKDFKKKINNKIKELDKEIEKINNKNDGYWEDTSIILDEQKQALQELLEE